MNRSPIPVRRLLAKPLLAHRQARLDRFRVRLADGASTTVHVASYDRAAYAPRVVAFDRPEPLVRWCREENARDAVVGGFFLRPGCAPLGELRIGGERLASVPFTAPWSDLRACLQVDGGQVRIARRDQLPADPAGDLLQAGPLLLQSGQCQVDSDGSDPEGFRAASHQFDSDITDGRHPRAALALAGDRILAIACDGRTRFDAGMTLPELADALMRLGATDALNLDGGGSASLVHDGHLRNRPREQHGVDLLEGRAVVTAILFDRV